MAVLYKVYAAKNKPMDSLENKKKRNNDETLSKMQNQKVISEKYNDENHKSVIKSLIVSGDYTWSIQSTAELYDWVCDGEEESGKRKHMSSDEFIEIIKELRDDDYINSMNVTLHSINDATVNENLIMVTDKFVDFISAGFVTWNDLIDINFALEFLDLDEESKKAINEIAGANITENYFKSRILTYEKLFSLFANEESFKEYIKLNILDAHARDIRYLSSPEVELVFKNICENYAHGKFYKFNTLNQKDMVSVLKLFSLSLVKGFFSPENDGKMFLTPNLKVLADPSYKEFTWLNDYDLFDSDKQVDLMFSDSTYEKFINTILPAEDVFHDVDIDTNLGYISKNQDVFSQFIQMDEENLPLKDFYSPEDMQNIYNGQILLALKELLGDELIIDNDVDPDEILNNFIEKYTEQMDFDIDDTTKAYEANESNFKNNSANVKSVKLTEDEKKKLNTFLKEYTVPKIVEFLDENVAGQKEAKEACSLLLYKKVLQVLRIDSLDKENEEFESSNLLVVGPTGCGKTYIWNTLKKISPIPIFIHDVSSITIAGYKGDDLDIIFSEMIDYVKNGTSKTLLESSFFVLDEFDKICKSEGGQEHGFSRQTQGQMLSIVEGTTIRLGRNSFDTKNMEFIFLGAFEDIYLSLKEKHKYEKPKIGFVVPISTTEKKDSEITMDDIIKYGLRSELAGRIGNFVTINALTEDEMKSIIRVIPANLIKKAKEKYKSLGFDIEVEESAADEIAKIAFSKKLGARSIKKILDRTIDSIIFLNPNFENKEKMKLITIKKENISKK